MRPGPFPDSLTKLRQEGMQSSDDWGPPPIVDGNEAALAVTVTGAKLGDFVLSSFSLDVEDLQLNSQVTAADTVTHVLSNNTGGTITLASGEVCTRAIGK